MPECEESCRFLHSARMLSSSLRMPLRVIVGSSVMNLHHVVRTVDVSGIFLESKAGREELRFRVEVLRLLSPARSSWPKYSARVLRLDTFRVPPSFPQKNGKPSAGAADSALFVVNDAFAVDDYSGDSASKALNSSLKAIRRQFGI